MRNQYINKLLDRIFPRQCVLCEKYSDSARDVCLACESQLPQATGPACVRCAALLTVDRGAEMICGQCQQQAPLMRNTIACFYYKPPITTLIADLKFHRQLPNARLLGTLMAEQLSIYYQHRQHVPDYIIPMPLHRKRLCARGFNQSVELAKPISCALNIPIHYRAVKRHRDTPNQSSLPAKQRRQNVRHAFTVTQPLQASCVAIIDDVMTTGSTANALCAALLHHCRIDEIHVWCCARA